MIEINVVVNVDVDKMFMLSSRRLVVVVDEDDDEVVVADELLKFISRCSC